MITLTIDDKSITVAKGTTVYNAAKTMGIELPIFCYQDRMPPFGACRVCLVEVEKMNKLQTSCTLECQEGMVVRTQAHPAVKAREEILEFLLINHPLDCPICDRGGECPLQDQALEFGPGKSRFFEEKRHFEKPLYLGPVLTLDRERCIACARCTRFGDIVAGDHALEFIDRGYRTEVGTVDGEAPKSKFIGNTIMICPVGALTSSVYRFRARPWDNFATETTCTLCPVVCSMILDSRDGEIMRTRSCEKRDVNDIWLCDKGWFGYEFSSSDKRLSEPLMRKDGQLVAVSWDDAFSFVAAKLSVAKNAACFGGNTLTVEENYLLQQLFRETTKSNNIDHRIGMPIFSSEDEGFSGGMQITLGEVEALDRAVILGSDITEEFPVLWLRLKQAINKGCKVLFLGHFAPEVSRYFEKTVLHAPLAELSALASHKDEIEAFLKEGTKSALFVGSQYLATPNRKAILAELLSWQLSSLNLLEGSNNSMGARFAGMHPEFGPQGQKLAAPGKSYLEVLDNASKSNWDLLYAVGCDPASKMPEHLWQKVRKNLGCLIVQDIFMTKTAQDADLILPTLSYVEKGGSFCNIEGRIQKLKPGKSIPKGIYADSYIFIRIAQKCQKTLMIDEHFLEKLKPGLLTFPRPKRLEDMPPLQSAKGPLATFSHALFDQGIRMQHNSQLSQLAKTPTIRIHPDTQIPPKLPLPIVKDPNVAPNTLVIPHCPAAYTLGPNLLNGQEIP